MRESEESKEGLNFEYLQSAQDEGGSISKIYAETFVKLFNTKVACCDWKDLDKFTHHLKYILLRQYKGGDLPSIDPFSLFMLDFTMDDKLAIAMKWADSEKKKALN